MDIASLGIRIDSSQAKEAVSSMDKLAAVGSKVQASIAATAEESEKLGKSMKTGAKAVADTSRSIDQYIKSLQTVVATTGMSSRETALYSLALKGANSAQLQAADSALRMNEAYEKGVEIGDNLKKGLLAIGVAATTGLIAAAVAFESFVHKAGEFQDLAEKTGDSAQNIASLAVSAGVAGVSMSRIADFSVKLSKNLTGVDDESKAAGAAITALGLDLETFKNLKPADQIEQLSKALNSFNDSGAKAAAIDALAKGSADLLPFLKELGQEGSRQVILTEEQIRLADDYSDKQAKLRTQLTLHAEAIASQMLPAYNAFSEVLVDVAKEILNVDGASKKLGQGGEIREFAERAALSMARLADAGYFVSQSIVAIGESYGAAAAAANQFAHLNFAAGSAVLRDAREQGNAMRLNLGLADKLEAKFAATGRAAAAASANPADYSNEGRSSGGKTLQFDGRVKPPKKDSTAGQIAKAQLAFDIEEIRKANDELISIYSNAERMVDAERSANLLSEKEYYAAKLGLLNLNTQGQENALKSELARLNAENLSGKAKLENDRKILDVESKLEKLRQGAATSVTVLGIQQRAAADSITRGYEEARIAAQGYLDTINRAAARTIAGIGKGDKDRARGDEISQIDQKFDQQRRELEKENRTGKLTDEQYRNRLAIIDEFNAKEIEATKEKNAKIDEANADWANGASRAMANYADISADTAKQMENLFTNAFKNAEDSLTSFVMTGKADFTGMISSFIADLARYEIKQAEAALIEKSGSWAKSGSNGIGDFITKYFSSFDGGGYTGSGSRSGGVDGKGGFVSILHPQETVVDHSRGQTLGGGGSISLTVNVDASGSDGQSSYDQAKQLGAMVGNIVIAKLVEQKRPGGMLA